MGKSGMTSLFKGLVISWDMDSIAYLWSIKKAINSSQVEVDFVTKFKKFRPYERNMPPTRLCDVATRLKVVWKF